MDFVDAHMHLDLMDDGPAFAAQAMDQGIGLFSNTVTPEGYRLSQQVYGSLPHVRVGLGLHPWWLEAATAQSQIEDFLQLLPGLTYVGEIGLDFAKTAESAGGTFATQEQQVQALRAIFEACVQETRLASRVGEAVARGASPDKVPQVSHKRISVHCVKAYDQLIQLLQETQVAFHNAVIIHWFSGTHDDLLALRDLGCWFSVGERFLSAKRGKAYLKDIPQERLLLETDAPPQGCGIAATYEMLRQLAGEDAVAAVRENAARVFRL